ncbi:unnamed protein product [Amoebophrya sp. A120]|nr:unnamed protein product [Amoebophrya sp. A120]|eukprot:GSA120T00006471001.1
MSGMQGNNSEEISDRNLAEALRRPLLDFDETYRQANLSEAQSTRTEAPREDETRRRVLVPASIRTASGGQSVAPSTGSPPATASSGSRLQDVQGLRHQPESPQERDFDETPMGEDGAENAGPGTVDEISCLAGVATARNGLYLVLVVVVIRLVLLVLVCAKVFSDSHGGAAATAAPLTSIFGGLLGNGTSIDGGGGQSSSPAATDQRQRDEKQTADASSGGASGAATTIPSSVVAQYSAQHDRMYVIPVVDQDRKSGDLRSCGWQRATLLAVESTDLFFRERAIKFVDDRSHSRPIDGAPGSTVNATARASSGMDENMSRRAASLLHLAETDRAQRPIYERQYGEEEAFWSFSNERNAAVIQPSNLEIALHAFVDGNFVTRGSYETLLPLSVIENAPVSVLQLPVTSFGKNETEATGKPLVTTREEQDGADGLLGNVNVNDQGATRSIFKDFAATVLSARTQAAADSTSPSPQLPVVRLVALERRHITALLTALGCTGRRGEDDSKERSCHERVTPYIQAMRGFDLEIEQQLHGEAVAETVARRTQKELLPSQKVHAGDLYFELEFGFRPLRGNHPPDTKQTNFSDELGRPARNATQLVLLAITPRVTPFSRSVCDEGALVHDTNRASNNNSLLTFSHLLGQLTGGPVMSQTT